MCAINKTLVVQIIHENLWLKCPKQHCSQQLTIANDDSRFDDASSCWTSFQSTASASSGLQMKRYSQWCHLSMIRMIVCTLFVNKEAWCWCQAPIVYPPDLQPLDAIHSNLETGLHRAVLCWTRREGQWCILPGCPADAEDDASDQTHVRRLLRLSAGQRSSRSGTGHCCVATSGDRRIDWTRTLASKLIRSQSGWLQDLGFDTRTRLPDINTRHRWPEAAPHICLIWAETERRRQGNPSVMCMA